MISRRDFVRATSATFGALLVRPSGPVGAAAITTPSEAQLAWQRDELAMFFHFGVNTFSDREWGDGTEDPAIFSPTRLDARQWTRAAKAAGFRAAILTAKHHDGFCLWPTATTKHSVAASPWRDGKGDVVREFVDACRAEGLKPGLYLSPWDRNNPAYGDSQRYNDLYCDQLTELLTRYGPLAEIWFDGANGEGPNGKHQVYDWPRVWSLVRRLQPNAVMFSDAGPDVRWCGNERGIAGDPNWSAVNPGVVRYPGQDGPEVTPSLQHGDPAGAVWRPAECDVSIRPGWFHHPAEDGKVRGPSDLVNLYLSSVGRNAKLLLNVPPTRDGVLHDTDVARLMGFRESLDHLLAKEVLNASRSGWVRTGDRSAMLEVSLPQAGPLTMVRLEEEIGAGQAVSRHRILGLMDDWREIVEGGGTTIGYARIHLTRPEPVRGVRLIIDEAVRPPGSVRFRLFV